MRSQTNLNHSKIQEWKKKAKFERITRWLFYLLVMFILTSAGTLVNLTASPTEARELRPVATNQAVPFNASITPAEDVSGVIIAWEYDQLKPAVAYGSQRGEYLVVWEDHHWGWGNDRDIYGRRVSAADGAPVGDHFGIAYAGTQLRFAPDIAYNQTNDEFLVVYEFEYSPTDHDILARRLGSDGNVIGDEIEIIAYTNFERNPAIVYNPVDNEYLVVWERRLGSGEFTYNDIYARRVSASGTWLSGEILVASGSPDQLAPAVAYGGGVYLVVWQDKQSTGDYDIHGQRLGNNGAPIGGEIKVSNGAFATGDQLKPRLAFNSAVNEFFVVWENRGGNSWDIYGRRINTNGNLVSGVLKIVQESNVYCENPDVAYDGSTDKYVVAWQYRLSGDSLHCIGFYLRVNSEGTPQFLEGTVAPYYIGQPVVATDDNGGHLSVWEDGRHADTSGIDLYYWLFSESLANNVYLPIILRPSG